MTLGKLDKEDIRHYSKVTLIAGVVIVVVASVLLACVLVVQQAAYVDPQRPDGSVWYSPSPSSDPS